ncbi:MAG: peptide chain release factor N(5)-glutamine methyltransferase [Clostridia bacterium]|nr:peptide chain release factor N(5)-glutamine methyltransferase [Clostridia bacterium]
MRLSDVKRRLRDAGIENAVGESLMLFRHFTTLPEYALRLDDPEWESAELRDAVYRREKREPLQYILGECAFFEEVYRVTPSVLIPRADTEILVEEILRHIREGDKLLDLCTGSGCIALSVLLHSKDTVATLVDLSADALGVADENRRRYHLEERTTLLSLDILKSFPEGKYNIIASNPPYIPEKVYETLAPEIFAEPKMAFVAEEDGMCFYRAIVDRGRAHLADDGIFAFEIGYDQEEKIRKLAEEYSLRAEIKRDLSDNPRVAILY